MTANMNQHRGWRSTKLHLSIAAMGIITAAFAMTGWNEHCFDGFTMGIMGVLGFYSGASTYEKVKGAAPTPQQGEQ